MTESTWEPVDMTAASLDFLEWIVQSGSEHLTVLHKAIEESISTILSRLEALPPDDDDHPWVSGVVDEELDVIEDLVGVGFVVVQTYMTTVRSHVASHSALRERCGKGRLSFLQPAPGAKIATKIASMPLLDLDKCSPKMNQSAFTKVRILNAVADYWKHSEEWNSLDWTTLDPLPKNTAEKMRIAGASPHSTGNLKTAAKAFGLVSYDDLTPIRACACDWALKLFGHDPTRELNRREL